MNDEGTYRLLTVVLLGLAVGISSYYRRQADRQGGRLGGASGLRLVVILRLLSLLVLLPLFGYLNQSGVGELGAYRPATVAALARCRGCAPREPAQHLDLCQHRHQYFAQPRHAHRSPPGDARAVPLGTPPALQCWHAAVWIAHAADRPLVAGCRFAHPAGRATVAHTA